MLGAKIDPKSLGKLTLDGLDFDLMIGWFQDGRQDRSKSAPGGVLGRLGRGLGPLLGAFGPSLDGLGRVLDRLEGSLEVVLSSFWSSLIRFIVSTS